MNKVKIARWLLMATAILAIAALVMMGPIVQDEAYHLFADQRTILGIPNFWDVMSNLPFLIIGLLGLRNLRPLIQKNYLYGVLFVSMIVMGFGSAYYHLAPDTDTLFWDRLPMTFTFMSLFAIVLSEFIADVTGKRWFIPLLIIGVASVLLWRYGPSHDLRLYAVVQFYPMIALPVVVICYTSAYTRVNAYWHLLLAYLVAKVFEHFDKQVFEILGVISGHSLKHLAAGLGLYLLYVGYRKRTLVK